MSKVRTNVLNLTEVRQALQQLLMRIDEIVAAQDIKNAEIDAAIAALDARVTVLEGA